MRGAEPRSQAGKGASAHTDAGTAAMAEHGASPSPTPIPAPRPHEVAQGHVSSGSGEALTSSKVALFPRLK